MEDGRFLPPGYDENEAFSYNSLPPLTEDTSWIGLVGFLIIPAGLVTSLFSKDKRIKDYAVFSGMFGLVYMLFVIAQRASWDPYQGRYFIMGLIPAIPLISGIVPNKKPFDGLVMATITILVVGVALNTFIFNESKTILSKYQISLGLNQNLEKIPKTGWVNQNIRRVLGFGFGYLHSIAPEDEMIFTRPRYFQVYNSNLSTVKKLVFVDQVIPEGESIYLLKPSYTLEFGLFGENITRKLFPIKSLDQFRGDSFLITHSKIKAPEELGLSLIGKFDRIYIYR